MKRMISIVILSAGLVACGSTSKPTKQDNTALCSESNWQQVGYKLALAGKDIRTFNTLKADCNNDIADSAKTTYIAGYHQGIKEYCTYENGLALGKEGKENVLQCPKELREGFDKGYQTALKAVQQQNERARRAADREQMRKQQSSDLIGSGRSQ